MTSESYQKFLVNVGKYLLQVLLNDGAWPCWLSPLVVKILCNETLDTDDLLYFFTDVSSVVDTDDTQSMIVNGVDGPLAKCSTRVEHNYSLLLDEDETLTHPSTTLADRWRKSLLQYLEDEVLEKPIRFVRKGFYGSPHLDALLLRWSAVHIVLVFTFSCYNL